MPGDRGSVLIVEDTLQSAELVAALVETEGFNPVICASARAAREAFAAERPVAIILDWVLPDAPGSELCREIRAKDQAVSIMFVSGRGDETSVSRGLDAGADDYITKPVRPGELIARLEAHLRRAAALRAVDKRGAAEPARERHQRFGPMQIDLDARRVTVNGDLVKLAPLEFKLLEYLVRNAGVALSREQILAEVYGIDAAIDTGRVDLLVRRLRLKLGEGRSLVVSHAGYGYMLEKQRGR